MSVSLINMTPNPLSVIALAASKCYNTKDGNREKMIDSLYKSGHTSVFEHVNFTFDIEDISRACLAQLSRHRFLSMTVRSQRYCIETSILPIAPLSISRQKESFRVWLGLQRASDKAYRVLLKQGIKPEDARSVLTNAHPTTLVLTVNLRSLMHICNERLCSRAQHEIRELTQSMRDLVVKEEPLFDKFLVPKCEYDKDNPHCPENKSCGRYKKLGEQIHPAQNTNQDAISFPLIKENTGGYYMEGFDSIRPEYPIPDEQDK